MIRKFATIAAFAGAALISTYAVYASHLGYPSTHIIFGKAYFYSLNLFAFITKLSGRDIKDGTQLRAEAKLLVTETACLNPQNFNILPGNGPKANLSLLGQNLDGDDLVKSDRTKSTFATTATGELVLSDNRLDSICKDALGTSQWYQLYWQDKSCNRGEEVLWPKKCYEEYAYFAGDWLVKVTKKNTTPNCTEVNATCLCNRTQGNLCGDWTFVFLPKAFVLKSWVVVGTLINAGQEEPGSDFYWSCQFKTYSLSSPPSGGWAGVTPAEYNCTEITQEQYRSS